MVEAALIETGDVVWRRQIAHRVALLVDSAALVNAWIELNVCEWVALKRITR